ncbi:glycerophosphodiester phosphodiesterase [Sphingobacterium endophyticum]|uniref:glycerophosphodiester phosphodiesterase n=1 Tax=Sphingobacterium endophyticum TaxID=2546448 RepID=UPI0018CDC4D1|nr:glycerophosphodiester phosphodiesterase [Sphingobacterium endophyticum]
MKSTYLKHSLICNNIFLLMILLFALIPEGFSQSAEVKLFAHRAGAHEFDENTMQAFQASYDKGLRGFETDVRLSKDGHLVIFHDDSFERIVGIKGGIEDLTLEEIKKLKTKKGNPIPTLDEVVAFFKDKPGVYIEFEMKTNKPVYDEEKLHKYCDELYKRTYSNKPVGSDYLLTSFDKRPLQYLKKTYPDVDMLFIKGEGLSQKVVDEAKELGIKRIGASVHGTTRNMVIEAKKQGIMVSLWPGRSIDDFLLGVYLGSDYLCSDVPVAVTEWVQKNAPQIKLK